MRAPARKGLAGLPLEMRQDKLHKELIPLQLAVLQEAAHRVAEVLLLALPPAKAAKGSKLWP